jgi:hypothetical protein
MRNGLIDLKKLSVSRLSIGICAAVLSLAGLPGCSENQASDPQTTDETTSSGTKSSTKVAADSPTDSTGAFASLKIDFATTSPSAALMLADEAATSIDLGNGIVISDARVNIKTIKIKAKKEHSDEEKALKDHLEEEKKSDESAQEGEKSKIEKNKHDLDTKYEPLMEAAETNEARDALKEQMKAEMAVVEADKAELEKAKEEKEEKYEAEHDGNLKWKGPYVYDLVKGTVDPALPAIEILDGSYRRIEFKVKPSRDVEGTDPLINKSIYVAGTVLIADVSTPFEVALRVNQEFRLWGNGAVLLDSTVDNSMAIAFDPKLWFANIDLSTATLGADGVIHVDDVDNTKIMNDIRHNIVKSTRFGKDNDHDGKLGESESEGDGAEGIEAEDAEQSVETQQKQDKDHDQTTQK